MSTAFQKPEQLATQIRHIDSITILSALSMLCLTCRSPFLSANLVEIIKTVQSATTWLAKSSVKSSLPAVCSASAWPGHLPRVILHSTRRCMGTAVLYWNSESKSEVQRWQNSQASPFWQPSACRCCFQLLSLTFHMATLWPSNTAAPSSWNMHMDDIDQADAMYCPARNQDADQPQKQIGIQWRWWNHGMKAVAFVPEKEAVISPEYLSNTWDHKQIKATKKHIP